MAANSTDVGARERDALFVPVGLGALALLATLLGRGLAVAVPGAISGFDRLVNAIITAGAFCSQLFAIAGAIVSLRLALGLTTHPALPFWRKATFAGSSVFVCLVVFFSAQPRLFLVGPLVLTLVSFIGCGLLLYAAGRAALDSSTRALSVLATLAGLTAAVHTAARLVALDASSGGDGLQYDIARAIATVASALDLALVVASGLWLWLRVQPHTKAWSVVALACIPALFIGSPERGPRYLLQRMADALTSHPDPFLPLFAQWGLESFALTLSAACLADSRPPRLERLALAFALLGRTTSDRPLGALLLILSAFCILLPMAVGPMSEHSKPVGNDADSRSAMGA